MELFNKIFVVFNLLVFACLIRASFKLAKRDKPKFYSLSQTIKYWAEKLNHGDKFVIFPLTHENFTDANDKFLQFKIYKSTDKKLIDLVYPLKSENTKDLSKKKELISLSKFFELNSKIYEDRENQLSFFFYEIDPELPNHSLFLTSLGRLQKGFELNTEIGIRTIPNSHRYSDDRYLP